MMTRNSSKTRTVSLIRRCGPSIIVVSVGVPGIGNIRTAHRLVRGRPSSGIVVLSVRSSRGCIARTLGANTDNCLLGRVSTSTLIRTMGIITSKKSCLRPGIARGLIGRCHHLSTMKTKDDKNCSSRVRVHHPLRLLAHHRYRMLRLLTSKGDGHKVNRTLCVDRGAIGGRIDGVLRGVGMGSHARTIMMTVGGN